MKNDLVTLKYAFQDEFENLEDDAECDDGDCNESDLPVLPQELSPPKGKTRSVANQWWTQRGGRQKFLKPKISDI